jgi:serpin B
MFDPAPSDLMPSHNGRAAEQGRPLLWLVTIVVLVVGIALSRGPSRNRDRAARQVADTISAERSTGHAGSSGDQPARPSNLPSLEPSFVARQEAKILQALDRDVTVDVIGRPLEEVLQEVARQLQVPFWLDRQTLVDEGVRFDEPVTIRLAGITGRSALYLILGPIQLTWLIEDEVLKVTTTVKASEKLDTRVYDVTDLVVMRDPRMQTRYSFTSLVSVIESSITPNSWENFSGRGNVMHLQSAETRELVIRQSQRGHTAVRALLADLRMARRTGPAEEVRPIWVSADESKTAVCGREIRRALERHVRIDLPSRSVEDLVVEVARQVAVPLVFDRAALRDEGVRINEPLTFQQSDITASSALKLLLEPVQLTWIIRDEVLFITTSTNAGEHLESRVYDVADIVPAFRSTNGTVSHDFTSLMHAISSSIQPDGWEDGGAYIPVFRDAGILALVIRQTQSAQQEIATFLEELRALRRHWTGAPVVDLDADNSAKSISQNWSPRAMGLFDAKAEALVRGNDQFALDLYRQLARNRAGNLIMSPYAVCCSVGAVSAGARGETAREISETMHFVVRQEDLPAAFRSLRTPLAVWASWDPRFQPSSQLWRRTAIDYVEQFQKILREFYVTKIASLDYSDPGQAAQAVNDWNLAQTRGSILRMASASDFNEANRLVVTSAVDFNRKWSEPFNQKATQLAQFTSPTAEVEVAMMHLATNRCRYALVDGVQVLVKPYGDGDLSMVILLPPAGMTDISDLEQALTDVNLMRFLAATDDSKVEVFLPRFKLESVINLRDSFETLGMRLAFDARSADFSGISDRQRLALGAFIHKAYIEVEEEGPPSDPGKTSFGGARGPGMGYMDVARAGKMSSFEAAIEPDPDQPVFRADHPFVFLIRDNHTGAVVFIGRLVNPGS